jgi:hypothetical protein
MHKVYQNVDAWALEWLPCPKDGPGYDYKNKIWRKYLSKYLINSTTNEMLQQVEVHDL